jgi:hypothetical protein
MTNAILSTLVFHSIGLGFRFMIAKNLFPDVSGFPGVNVCKLAFASLPGKKSPDFLLNRDVCMAMPISKKSLGFDCLKLAAQTLIFN